MNFGWIDFLKINIIPLRKIHADEILFELVIASNQITVIIVFKTSLTNNLIHSAVYMIMQLSILLFVR
jgi:hypothetical protein